MRTMAEAHPNAQVIEQLYAALDAKDGETMASLYTGDAVFHDPAFGELHGPEVGAMWRMLCEQAADLSVKASDVKASNVAGSASWVAHYTFSQTGRKVENRVTAAFKFHEGKISEHRDSFSMLRWARQALGPAGLLLGSNPVGRALMQKRTGGMLEKWRERQAS
jgi:ketosteroid isomerase-like protein